jgi:hypothetical protein
VAKQEKELNDLFEAITLEIEERVSQYKFYENMNKPKE